MRRLLSDVIQHGAGRAFDVLLHALGHVVVGKGVLRPVHAGLVGVAAVLLLLADVELLDAVLAGAVGRLRLGRVGVGALPRTRSHSGIARGTA